MDKTRFKAQKMIMQRSKLNNCPVVPLKSTIYKDLQTGKLAFTNVFKNASQVRVEGIAIRISCFDDDLKLIGTIKNYQYKNLTVGYEQEFGSEKFVALPNETITNLAVAVTHVDLAEGYYWDESTGRVMNVNDENRVNTVTIDIPVVDAPSVPGQETVQMPIIPDVSTTSVAPIASATAPVASATPEATTTSDLNSSTPSEIESEEPHNVVTYNPFLYGKSSAPLPGRETVPTTSSSSPLASDAKVEGMDAETSVADSMEPSPSAVSSTVASSVSSSETSSSESSSETLSSVSSSETSSSAVASSVQTVTGAVSPAAGSSVPGRPDLTSMDVEYTYTPPESKLKSLVNKVKEVLPEKKAKPDEASQYVNPALLSSAEERPPEPEIDPEVVKAEKKKKRNRIIKRIVLTCVFLAVIAAGVIAFMMYQKYDTYNRAARYVETKQFDYAISSYTKLGNYKDSQALLLQAREKKAAYLAENHDYSGAIEIYNSLGLNDLVTETYNDWALYYCETGDYNSASSLVSAGAVSYRDDVKMKIQYGIANQYFNSNSYDLAIQYFDALGDYEDSKNMLHESYYQLACLRLSQNEFEEAITYFTKIGSFKDAPSKLNETYYAAAEASVVKGEYEKAITYYTQCKNYSDAATKLISTYYTWGKKAYSEGDYAIARDCFNASLAYEDAEKLYYDAEYHAILLEMQENVTADHITRLTAIPKDVEGASDVLKLVKKYVDYVGEYAWSSSNDQEVNSKGGFEDHITVQLKYVNNELEFTVDGLDIDLRTLKHDSGSTSNTYTLLNKTTLTKTFNGKTHTYKKIVETEETKAKAATETATKASTESTTKAAN